MTSSLLRRRWPLPLVLAIRYLKSTRRDAFASFLSVVAALSIALGVAALILSLAVISGFQGALRSEILARTPQLQVELAPGSDADAIRQALLGVPGVREAQIQAWGSGWLVNAGRVQPVEMIGFAGRVPDSFPGAAGRREGLYVPSNVAARWGLEKGEPVTLVSPRPTLTPLGGPQPRVRTVPLAGTYRSSRAPEDRERIALPLAVAETLLGSEKRIEIRTASLDEAEAVAARLGAVLPPGSEVLTWKDLNRPLLFALRLEKVLMFVAVFLVVVVAALALVADLALIIATKVPEIGILSAMGATPGDLRRAFLTLGGLVSASGMILGGTLGIGASTVLDRYRLVQLPGRVYFLDYVPFRVEGGDLGAVLLLTFALALLASFWAAKRVSSLDPVEAMQR
jgi:lipoprotein-releasing system permease protein